MYAYLDNNYPCHTGEGPIFMEKYKVRNGLHEKKPKIMLGPKMTDA